MAAAEQDNIDPLQKQWNEILDAGGDACIYKVVLIGDGAVGKSSICQRFAQDSFNKAYKQTIGLDFYQRVLRLPTDTLVALQCWDICGQSIGSAMIRNYLHGAQAIILVYDITNYASFQNLQDWLDLIHHTFERGSLPYLVLVGNKIDLISTSSTLHHSNTLTSNSSISNPNNNTNMNVNNVSNIAATVTTLPITSPAALRAVHSNKHNMFIQDHAIPYGTFVSAKTGEAINNLFFHVALQLAGLIMNPESLMDDSNDLDETPDRIRLSVKIPQSGSEDIPTVTQTTSTTWKCIIQ